MEEDEILGNGMKFSPEEKTTAHSTVYHIANFYGQSTNSQVQMGTKDSSQNIQSEGIDLQELGRLLLALKGLSAGIPSNVEGVADLKQEIGLVETEIAKDNPDHEKVNERLGSIKRILESAVGSAGGVGIQNIINWVASIIG